jgi:hypothetical protein
MHAVRDLGLQASSASNDRPTIPVPRSRDSGVRLSVARVPSEGAVVDVVLCDLSRDPRSEDFAPERANAPSSGARARGTLRRFDWETFAYLDVSA